MRGLSSNVTWLLLAFCVALLTGCGAGSTAPNQPTPNSADVIVYCATPSGIMASIEAAQLGKTVILLEPSQHVGGMTSNGLGETDGFNDSAIGGLVDKFFQTVASIYSSDGVASSGDGKLYAPHIAEQAFNQMIAGQSGIQVVYGVALSSISKTGAKLSSVTMSNGVMYSGSEFIDASYEGDLMAAANVTFSIGRESAAQYGESYAGTQVPTPMGARVDPYIVEGDSASGLIAHVVPDAIGAEGSADTAVMAYDFRLCASTDPTNQIPFAAPTGYDPAEFEVAGRLAVAAAA